MEQAWTTPQMKASIEKLEAEAKALADSRIVKTEEARSIISLMLRLLETLLHGEPKTELPKRHHE
jgi:hypothetical protein